MRSFRRGGSVKVGCLVALAIVLLLLASGAIFVWLSWKGWVASGVMEGTNAVLAESKLPADQQVRIRAKVQSVADGFKDGKISMEQLGNVAKSIAESPLLPVGLVVAFEKGYVEPSALTATEKADGSITLQRLARGVYEKKISENDLQEVLKPLSVTRGNGNTELKKPDQVTVDELRAFLKTAAEKADAASVSKDPFTIDIASELEKAVDGALVKK